jgi:hypothetical protein
LKGKTYMRYVLALVAALALSACTDTKGAQDALEDAGYTQIKITGYQFFACSQDDTYATGFEATSSAGHRVSGVVCAGFLFKGATIRTFGRMR